MDAAKWPAVNYRIQEKEFALQKTAGHCYACGISIGPACGKYTKPSEGFEAKRYTVLLNKHEGATAENLAAMCTNCGTRLNKMGGLEGLRWYLAIRAQGLKFSDLAVLRSVGVKPRLRYWFFWAEVDPGARIVGAFMRRYFQRIRETTGANDGREA